jgi:hypothetical protein
MATHRLDTLYDCAVYGQHIKVGCLQCQRQKIFDAGRLWWLFKRRGWDDKLRVAGRHLRCAGCGGKNVTVRPTFEEPTGIQPVSPTSREWKEHVRRQRG